MVRVEEANISSAMGYVFDEIIKPLDPEGLLDYSPKTQKSSWLRDNPTTGVIFLKKHPNAKVAWVLCKFEQKTDLKYGTHSVAQNKQKITSPQEFEDFFGVKLPADFNFADDMQINVSWDRQTLVNKNYNRDFDEYAYNFYMYSNHSKTNLKQLMQRLYRINEIIEKDPKAIIGNMFNIPYSATNI